jgi:hypothetical protein
MIHYFFSNNLFHIFLISKSFVHFIGLFIGNASNKNIEHIEA